MLDFTGNLNNFESSNIDFADDLKNKHKEISKYRKNLCI
mgnify:CR=1 FL=1